VSAASGNTMTSAIEPRETVATSEPVVAVTSQEIAVEHPATLPQTASPQPLLLILGFLALGCAALVAVVRSPRMV
jgi:LPXTG-motif cell wall-anchored protein